MIKNIYRVDTQGVDSNKKIELLRSQPGSECPNGLIVCTYCFVFAMKMYCKLFKRVDMTL